MKRGRKPKYEPFGPLPYIDRAEVDKVKVKLAVPTECPYCKGPVELVTEYQAFDRTTVNWPYVYRCKPCDAHTWLHPHTHLPLGTLAHERLRTSRELAEKNFKRMYIVWGDKPQHAYKWLSKALGIPLKDCDFNLFTGAQCGEAERLCELRLQGSIPEGRA